MSLLTISNVFVQGTTINAAPFNQNFNAVVASVNSIDNTNIGPAGTYASQILPVSLATATFGGAFGYEFSPGAAAQIPLTLSGFAGQSVDLFDINLTHGGTKEVWVTSAGVFNTLQAPVFGAPLGAASGGTGSATQNFVDLTTVQASIGGAKTFTAALTASAGFTTTTLAMTGALTGATTLSASNQVLGVTSVVGGSTTPAGMPSGTVASGATATSGYLWMGNGTTAQTSYIASSANVMSFYPTSSLAAVASLNAAGNFTATTFTGALSGNATTATNLSGGTVSGTTGAFSGLLSLSGGANQLVFSSGGATNIQTYANGAVVGWTFDASNGAALTGDILRLQIQEVTKFQVLNGGGVTSQGLGTFVGLTAGTGTVKGASDGATNTYVLPLYTSGGVAAASTAHAAFGLGFFSAQSSITITLSNAASFVSTNTYCVLVDQPTGGFEVVATKVSGSSFTLSYINTTTGVATSTTGTYYFAAIGT